ncbi:hypothetical protein F1D05_13665 [Kribbella qitaiheensis]|uniref:Uncharacterized protein n=1 Tax=Kribbella qitaiheensis TaxID=1544730 RepID=A0A7G6WXP3_9ACTN|nr:hypothetical protein [Kribbella qitaiheensis]QNE18758.1 hypothetical protein F1D05_13665 [Kribbella qitaiheensis]
MSLTFPASFADGNEFPVSLDEATRVALEVASVQVAFDDGMLTDAWELAWALEPRLAESGRWQEVLVTQKVALAAAIRLGDWLLEGQARLAIGRACLESGDFRRAGYQLAEGASILRSLGVPVD